MLHSINNNFLKLTVNEIGMEIISLISLSNNLELIWEATPSIWASSAPVLFPIVGGLKDGEFYFEGNTYKMLKHGIVRGSSKAKLIESSESHLMFEVVWDEESLKVYPFKFRFLVSFILVDHKLMVHHEVINQDSKALYFSLGAHPAFKVPLFENEVYSDYSLEFEHTEIASTWLLDTQGTISNTQEMVLDDTSTLPLHEDLFNKDALIFKDLKSRKVTLQSKKSGRILSVIYPDFKYLGIWAKPKASFVCIEPWLGVADSTNHSKKLEEKEGIIKLDISSHFEAEYEIEVLIDKASRS